MYPYEEDNLLPIEAAAAWLGIPESEIERDVRRGKLRAQMIGHALYFREDDLIDYEIRKETMHG